MPELLSEPDILLLVSAFVPLAGRRALRATGVQCQGLEQVGLRSRHCLWYAFGGHSQDDAERVGSTAVQLLDLRKGTWEVAPNLCEGRTGAAAAVLDGRLVVCGGCPRGSSPSEALRSVESFDPAEGRWEALPPMTLARCGAAAASLGRCLFVCGGMNPTTRSVEFLDMVSRRWQARQPKTGWSFSAHEMLFGIESAT
ncbi:unnamed protein product [Polarella glacialis]|uniref:Uncharacterized protein n=1 Tax=Polarella glacialis TaxID=89957 RepID=A0A813G065_POLGL|nr:unnamed protein product [Polarella glacialis]